MLQQTLERDGAYLGRDVDLARKRREDTYAKAHCIDVLLLLAAVVPAMAQTGRRRP